MNKSMNILALREKYSKKYGEKCSDERGAVALFTALTMLILIFFVGLAIDLSMVFMDKSDLDDLCQVVCEDRYVHDDLVRFANDPAQATVSYVTTALVSNGFTGEFEVTFNESSRSKNKRVIDVDVTLTRESPLFFLKLFGASSPTVSSTVSYEDVYGEGGDDVVWAPVASASSYNGTYRRVI